MMKKLISAAALLSLIALSVASVHADDAKLTFDHYYDGPAVVKAIHDLHNAFPTLTTLQSIGQSEEGRDLWLLTINNSKTGKDTDKPGVYVDGAIHGNEIQATEVCLYLASYMLNSYGENEMITHLLDSCAFYILPVVNVDGRWHFFADPSGYNLGRSGRVPYDDDHDGLVDEDGVEDLDGDGEILQMRIKDPFGRWKTSPDDPRVMVRVKPGEKGEWTRLGEEGIDNDGDGRINEDGPGYLDMNRNYGFAWQPPYVQDGAGDFPMSGKVTKAVSDFVSSKPNICFNFAYHNAAAMILRGPGSKEAGFYSPADVEVYDFLGKEGEKIIPGYQYGNSLEMLYPTYGDFDEWTYSNLGIYGFVSELFNNEQEQYRKPDEKKKGEDESWYGGTPGEEKQKFNDNVNQGSMFTNWHKFHHPQLGDIEIGGWRTFTTRMPPLFLLPEEVHRNASHVIFVARNLPHVTMEVIEKKDLGDGLHRIRVRLANDHAIPTLSNKARKSNLVRQDIVKIEGSGIEVVSGAFVDDIHMDRISPVEDRPWMIFTTVPAFGKRDIQWIVRGSGTAKITYDAKKARNLSQTVQL